MAVTATRRAAAKVEPKSPHVSDSAILPFLQHDFDPAEYLNGALPSLSTTSSTNSGTTYNAQHGSTASLAELTAQTQTLLSQLNAQTSRLSKTLTQLTDDILRSGGRLAYEVEVLKGETTGLADALDNGLRNDIERFASAAPAKSNGLQTPGAMNGSNEHVAVTKEADTMAGGTPTLRDQETSAAEPEYIERLRTLTLVRSRLEGVIKVFGEAMQWPIAPSELSVTSSFISVSAPEGGQDDSRSREEKGKAYAETLRNEINDLIGNGNDLASLNTAASRLEDLRDLAQVWNGTAEEKARNKFVESFTKPVEDRQRALGRTAESRRQTSSPSRGIDYRYGGTADQSRAASEGGYGFLQNLQRIKNDVYLD